MTYEEFVKRVGKITKITDLTRDMLSRLIFGEDCIHFVVHLGDIEGLEYTITISEEMMQKTIEVIETLESRHAVREKDYIVAGSMRPDELTLQIHTTNDFLSDEDFDPSIERR